MEDPNYCMNEACLKKRKEKDDEIKKLQIEVDELAQKLRQCQKKLKESEKTCLSHEDIKTDKNIKFLTGTPTKVAFDALFTAVSRNVKKVRHWTGPLKFSQEGRNFKKCQKKFGPKRGLSQKDEFLLTMMKIRVGSTNAGLAQRFGVSITSVSNIFTTWVKVLANQLRCMVYNPPIDVVKNMLPKKFRKPTEDNPDPELNLGYKTPLKPKKKLPPMMSHAPTKRPKRCKYNTEILHVAVLLQAIL